MLKILPLAVLTFCLSVSSAMTQGAGDALGQKPGNNGPVGDKENLNPAPSGGTTAPKVDGTRNAPGQPSVSGSSGTIGEKEALNPAPSGTTGSIGSKVEGSRNAPGQPSVPGTSGTVGEKESVNPSNAAKTNPQR
ncbi:MAG: hypothetical protein SGJ17_09535 [Hyphomicrobiales bacterium]|nr:hypothetical protein [Hyphomicrobiales bacterium]